MTNIKSILAMTMEHHAFTNVNNC